MYKKINNSNDHEYQNKRKGMKRLIIHVLTSGLVLYYNNFFSFFLASFIRCMVFGFTSIQVLYSFSKKM